MSQSSPSLVDNLQECVGVLFNVKGEHHEETAVGYGKRAYGGIQLEFSR
jgi:hypothetical protein